MEQREIKTSDSLPIFYINRRFSFYDFLFGNSFFPVLERYFNENNSRDVIFFVITNYWGISNVCTNSSRVRLPQLTEPTVNLHFVIHDVTFEVTLSRGAFLHHLIFRLTS